LSHPEKHDTATPRKPPTETIRRNNVKLKTIIIALALVATPAMAQESDEDRKVTLTVKELSAIIQSQVQLGIAQHNAQNSLAVVTKQIPQPKPPELSEDAKKAVARPQQ
jgi:uncharacterized membrane protein YdfJ with MMPL/SSD domain